MCIEGRLSRTRETYLGYDNVLWWSHGGELHGESHTLFRDFHLDDDNEYIVEVIDTWEMTITEIGTFKGKFRVPLTGKQHMEVRVKKWVQDNL